jgi:HEAT repeat protein
VIIDRLSLQQDPPWLKLELLTTLIAVALQINTRTSAICGALCDILTSDERDEIRSTAALGLGQLEMLDASETLLKVLRSGYPGLLAACIMALGDLGVPEAVDLIALHLGSDRPLIPQMAAQALGRIGPPARETAPALRHLANHGNNAERRLAGEALARILGR